MSGRFWPVNRSDLTARPIVSGAAPCARHDLRRAQGVSRTPTPSEKPDGNHGVLFLLNAQHFFDGPFHLCHAGIEISCKS
jgi:hypothetical protein